MTWTSACFIYDLTTSFELRAVDRSAFCHLSPRPAPPAPQSLTHILRRHFFQAAAQLEVACPFFCVLRDEHLSIDRPVSPLFAWPASSCCCWLRLLYR